MSTDYPQVEQLDWGFNSGTSLYSLNIHREDITTRKNHKKRKGGFQGAQPSGLRSDRTNQRYFYYTVLIVDVQIPVLSFTFEVRVLNSKV